MSIKQLIAAVAVFAAAGSAFAERPYPPDEPIMSTKSRAEVRAELEQARKDGLLMHSGEGAYMGEWSRPGAHSVAGSRYSGRMREEVRAEAIATLKTDKSSFEDMYGR